MPSPAQKRHILNTALRSLRYTRTCQSVRPASLLGYWPQAELSGLVALDASKNGRNGTYTAPALGAPGSGDGRSAPTFNGTSTNNNIFSSALASAFTGGEFTFHARIKAASAGMWTDATARRFVGIRVDASNYLECYSDGAGTLGLEYRAGAVSKFKGITTARTDWIDFALVVSKTADALRMYVDGVQVVTTSTSLGTWAGTPINMRVGSKHDASGGFWSGQIAHAELWSAPLTAAEIAALSERTALVVFEGDSRIEDNTALVSAMTTAGRSWGAVNVAIFGDTVSSMIGEVATQITPLYYNAGGNIAVVWGGVNDAVSGGASAATIWTNLQSVCANIKANGTRVALCTEIDAQNAGANAVAWHGTIMPALNTSINGSSGVADVIVNLGGDSRLANALDTTYFNADKLHLNATGYPVAGGLIGTALAAM